ncbi:MAG: hypothetical protein V4664_00865 [Patescibacteria group bacterium]
MKKDLYIKSNVFWKNFLMALVIYAGGGILACFIAGSSEEVTKFDAFGGLIIISIFAVVHSSYRMAMDFVQSVEISEFIEEKGITNKEFRDKYGELMDKISR